MGGGKIMEMEIWKPVIMGDLDFTGRYEVSNFGRVRSLNYANRGEVRELNQYRRYGTSKYLSVVLRYNGNKYCYLVHRLVGTMFLDNPENKPYIDHIDTDTLNNNVSNLRWVTAKENANNPISLVNKKSVPHKRGWKHSEVAKNKISEASKQNYRNGLPHPMLGKRGKKNPKSKEVVQINETSGLITVWENSMEVERCLGYKNSIINTCCNNKYSTHIKNKYKGSKWLYLNEKRDVNKTE